MSFVFKYWVDFSLCQLQIFNHKSNSNEEIHLAHIELPVRLPESLTDHQIAIVFQPTAWASPACIKTNQQPDDQLEVEEIFFFHQMCARWLSSLENDLWLNI